MECSSNSKRLIRLSHFICTFLYLNDYTMISMHCICAREQQREFLELPTASF